MTNRNKIKFINYKSIQMNEKPECRPWSPKNEV